MIIHDYPDLSMIIQIYPDLSMMNIDKQLIHSDFEALRASEMEQNLEQQRKELSETLGVP